MSDLREAFERVADRAARAARTQPASNVIRREIMALADRALSQPEAVEAVAWVCFDKIERRPHITTNPEDAADRQSRPNVWEVTPLFTAPPLAPDAERMRRALETTIRELERARDYNNAPNSVTITRLKEALSGAADASNASAEARLRAERAKLVEMNKCEFGGEGQMAMIRWERIDAIDHELATLSPADADEGKESEGGASRPYVPETEEEANELADNGRNTGGKSYYRPSDPTPPDRVPGLNWELSEETKKRLAEIDQAIVRPGDPRLNQIICGPQTNPVQDAEPATSVRLSRGSDQVGRTGGANPPTGSTPPDPKPWPNGCRNPNSCAIHRDCMYVGCTNYDRDISGEVDAALSTRAGG